MLLDRTRFLVLTESVQDLFLSDSVNNLHNHEFVADHNLVQLIL